MEDIDFQYFGVPPNENLLLKIRSALSKIEACGDVRSLSASLYFGDKQQYSLSKILDLPWNEYYMIDLGARMILELSDAERDSLFNTIDEPYIKSEIYKQQIKQWIEKNRIDLDKQPKLFPVASSVELLKGYVYMWNIRKHVRQFYMCCGMGALRRAIKVRVEIENAAQSVNVCSIAVEVLQEYDIYISHWEASHAHIKRERQVIGNNYKKFYNAIVQRDGEFCAECHAVNSLVIDHIKPVSKGGMSISSNLRLLCSKCNSAKSNKDYC